MISKEVKAQLTAEYGKTPTDTGSPAVQVAILTYRIKDLTEHLKTNHKDHHSMSTSRSTRRTIIQEEVFLRW